MCYMQAVGTDKIHLLEGMRRHFSSSVRAAQSSKGREFCEASYFLETQSFPSYVNKRARGLTRPICFNKKILLLFSFQWLYYLTNIFALLDLFFGVPIAFISEKVQAQCSYFIRSANIVLSYDQKNVYQVYLDSKNMYR